MASYGVMSSRPIRIRGRVVGTCKQVAQANKGEPLPCRKQRRVHAEVCARSYGCRTPLRTPAQGTCWAAERQENVYSECAEPSGRLVQSANKIPAAIESLAAASSHKAFLDSKAFWITRREDGRGGVKGRCARGTVDRVLIVWRSCTGKRAKPHERSVSRRIHKASAGPTRLVTGRAHTGARA